jgi:zinc protease
MLNQLLRLLIALALSYGFTVNAAPTKITEIEGITEYRLSNGLQVLLFPDPSKPITTVNLTYKVGSRHENVGETGMAHLLEHLLFKGTPTINHVGKMMAEKGIRNNATTWLDRTNYFEFFPANEATLDWVIKVEAERMTQSTFDRAGLDSEMTVVRNEFESGENKPWELVYKRVMNVAYDWHPYGRDTIGNRSDIENVQISNLRGFYERYYQPDNAVLLVAGVFDMDKTLALIDATFGKIAKPTRKLPVEWTVEPPQDGERAVTVRRVAQLQALLAAYKVPPGSHPDNAALSILADYLGDRVVGQLHKQLVQKELATEVFSELLATHAPGLMFYGAQLAVEQDSAKSEAAMLGVLEKPLILSDAEVKALVRAKLRDIEQTTTQTDRLAIALSEAIAMGDWRLFFYQRDQLNKVTAADVQRVAAQYLKPANRTLARFLPAQKSERVEIAARPDIEAALKGYTGNPNFISGEAFDVSPAAMQARAQYRTLSNGTELVVLNKKTRGGMVNSVLQLRYGTLASLSNRLGARSLLGEMLLRGTAKRDRQAIKEAFDELAATVAVNEGGATLSVKKPELAASFALLNEVMQQANFPASEFELVRAEKLAAITAQSSEPDALADEALQQHFNRFPKADPRHSPTMAELTAAIKQVTLAEVKALHQQLQAQKAIWVVVGDVTLNEVAALAEQHLVSWRSKTGYERLAQPYFAVPAKALHLPVADKDNAVLSGRLNIALKDTDPDYPALMIANDLLGGTEPSRLWQRIREKEGFSYDVRSGLSVDDVDASGTWVFSAIAAPANMPKVVATLREEIDKVLKGGYTDDEVAKAKAAWLQTRQLRRSNNDSLAANIVALAQAGRQISYLAGFDAKIAALTTAQVNTALRKYLRAKEISIITAGGDK